MQKKKSSKALQKSKLSTLFFLMIPLSSCEPELGKDDPTYLYDEHHDQQAMAMAKEQIGSRFDLYARLYIVQVNLSDYIDTHDQVDAQEIERYYKGYDSLDKELSRDVGPYGSALQLAKYFDAGILLFVKKDPAAANRLLDSYCPSANFSSYETRMSCHIENIRGYHMASFGRYDQETSYLINLILGTIYHDKAMIGTAMQYKALYDIDNANMQIENYLERNSWNDEVMKRYCEDVVLYADPAPVKTRSLNYQKYIAASQHANCPLYVELAEKEEEAERSKKHHDTDSAAPVPVPRQ